MKNIIKQSENFTKKNAINLGTGIALQEMAGQKIVGIKAAAIVDDIDRETGETKSVAALVDKDGMVYTSISATVLDSMEDVIDLLDEGEKFDIQVLSRKTKANRDFLSITVL